MKHIITQRDKDEIVNLYNKGYHQAVIAVETDYPLSTVKSIVKELTGYTQDQKPIYAKRDRTSIEKRNEKIAELFKSGKSISDICDMELLGKMTVEAILIGAGLIKDPDPKISKAIDAHDVKRFAQRSCNIGDTYIIKGGDISPFNFERKPILVTILKKYKYIVLTDQGSFQYIDIYNGTKVTDGTKEEN